MEPVYHQLHATFRVLPGAVVKEIETDEQKELRREVLGVTNTEVEEVKTKQPPYEDNTDEDLGGTSLHTTVEANDLASVKILLRSGEFDVRAKDQHGRTALGLEHKQPCTDPCSPPSTTWYGVFKCSWLASSATSHRGSS